MMRNLIAAVLGCLYVAGSIWLVHSEGQAYRASLNQTKAPTRELDRPPVSLTAANDAAAPSVAPSERTKPQGEPAAADPAPVAKDSPTRAPHDSSPAPPATELAAATPSTSPPKKKAGSHPAAKAVPDKPLASDSYWNQPHLARAWDVAYLKPDDERRLGAELHDLIIQFNPLLEEGPWLSRVEEVAEPLQKTLLRKDITYKFFILNSDAVNAFSTPGGYVYISRGLFDFVGEDEDYALQFAIGHEMAHVDLQHAIKCLQDPGVMKMHEGTLQKLYMLILPFGYLERESDKYDQEFEADEWIANRMQRIGRTRRETLVFLQKLEGYAKNNGFENGRIKPKPARGVSPLENHYRAQTAARKRLKHLKEFMDEAAKSTK